MLLSPARLVYKHAYTSYLCYFRSCCLCVTICIFWHVNNLWSVTLNKCVKSSWGSIPGILKKTHYILVQTFVWNTYRELCFPENTTYIHKIIHVSIVDTVYITGWARKTLAFIIFVFLFTTSWWLYLTYVIISSWIYYIYVYLLKYILLYV